MDSFIDSNNAYLNKFFSFISDSAYLIHGALLLLISAVSIFLLLILYKKIRRKFPVQVNCWFCNKNCKVPYELFNSWDCPYCEQYNGFTKDGNYNKVIKEQYNSKLNQEVFETLKSSTTRNESYNLQTNGFCRLCNINQQLKIQQLALFVPLNKNNYFEEIEQYKEKLEKAYQLCSKCEKVLQETLEKQEYNLLQTRLNDHKQKSPLHGTKLQKHDINEILMKSKKISVFVLQWVSMITAALLFIALFVQLETEFKFFYHTLPDFIIIETLQPIFKVVLGIIKDIYSYGKELSFAGFFCSLLCLIERNVKPNQINLIVWGLLHILLWTYMTGFQFCMSGVSLYFNHRIIYKKPIYFNKKPLLKKFGFQPEKRVFPKAFTLPNDETIDLDKAEPVLLNDSVGSSSSSSEINFRDPNKKLSNSPKKGNKRREKDKKNEIECLTDDGKDGIKQDVPNPKPLSSSVFNKSFLATLETEKNKETNEPMDEVYSNLSGLHLGGKQKKSSKPSNFLFSNHNFSEKKNTSSIIKPAKLVKNISSSWTDLNESASRSSTPSSGYSSQKAEKIEPNRYDFHKTMSPISVNPFSHPARDRFDFYDGGNGYYNNYNCFSPGFVPFQHFPGPMGHTTVYTCTRPGSFPFPFSFQGFPPQKFSPTSNRFSDASECENLFQNASKNFENSRKWVKLKAVAYFSIFLNIFTFFILVYFVSNEIIAVDWKLPKFNFFF